MEPEAAITIAEIDDVFSALSEHITAANHVARIDKRVGLGQDHVGRVGTGTAQTKPERPTAWPTETAAAAVMAKIDASSVALSATLPVSASTSAF